MRYQLQIWVLLAAVLMGVPKGQGADGGRRLINERRWHLGQAGAAEWDEFAVHPPDAPRLELTFQAAASDQETTLFIRQDDVRHDWFVELNGRRIGKLFLMEADLVSTLTIPAGCLRDGDNQLAIIPPVAVDDIVIQEVWLKTGTTARRSRKRA